MRYQGQTGGSKKNWSFDPAAAESIAPIRDALVARSAEDEYLNEDPDNHTTLAIVMDKILDDLPVELQAPVRLIHLEGKSHRAAARILGIDHKTVKARADRGVIMLKARLVDSLWVAEMLRGYIPKDEILAAQRPQGERVADILTTLKRGTNGTESETAKSDQGEGSH